jgi:hypothetical protein
MVKKCVGKVNQNSNIGKYVKIPKEKEDTFEKGDIVIIKDIDELKE